jgi:hypothetical protein
VQRLHEHSTIDVLTARGVLYSRGESYDENRLYSNPEDWPQLAETHRRQFLERTEGWERDDHVRRTVVFPAELAQRLAAEAGRRGISVSELLAEYAEQGLRQAR